MIDKQQLRKKLSNFLSDRRGNVAVIFALALVPMVGLIGAAVDYSHANLIKAAMQAAADATALAMSKTAGSLSASDLQAKSDAYFKALLNHPEAQGVTIATSYDANGGSSLTVAASATMPTNFMGMMGFKNLPINVTGQSAWGMSRLRVALVLDNTGSMAQAGKIDALKTATNNLLTQLKNAAVTNGDVYVSIVPFVKDVAVDTSNKDKNWIDWTDWNANNGTCKNYVGWSQPQSQISCLSHAGTWKPDNHDTWNGCITDRGGSLAPSILNTDTNVAPSNPLVTDTLFPAEQYDSCPVSVMPLNYKWSDMTKLVNSMSPNGNTNQAIGLAWGWLSLVGGGPFTVPTMDPKYQYSQIIILLTDGLNTQDRWYTDQASIDARQKITCDNIKAAKITLYTIQVNTDGDPTSTLLQNCASDPSKFFLLTSASQMLTTFNTIGTNLSQLRISK